MVECGSAAVDFVTPCGSALRLLLAFIRVVEKPGRFLEETNYELWLSGSRLMVVKCFNGRPPYYGRWIEIFAVLPEVSAEGRALGFAGSELERRILRLLASGLRGGEVIYVEYGYDRETETLLRRGVPPAVTRLGFFLLQLGFTHLKDWYYPEGFMEGGMKLQGEKPVDEDARTRSLRRLAEEVKLSLPHLAGLGSDPSLAPWARRALERARAILAVSPPTWGIGSLASPPPG